MADDGGAAPTRLLITVSRLRRRSLAGRWHVEGRVNPKDATESLEEPHKLLARRQLFETYCRFIMQEPRVSERCTLCQSALKHLRHSGSPMSAVKKTGI